jgi:hypothetical protein
MSEEVVTQKKLMFIKEWKDDRATMDFYQNIIENPKTITETESGKPFNGYTKAQMEFEYTKSMERAETLKTEIDGIEDYLFGQHKSSTAIYAQCS